LEKKLMLPEKRKKKKEELEVSSITKGAENICDY
jgi:hypothetical protein